MSTGRLGDAARPDRSKFLDTRTGRAISQFAGRAPFASTLRPNLTGGALPRTAGGYGLGSGRIGGKGGVEEVVFDPSSTYAHNEFELGIMRMFGGFSGNFMREYHAIVPKTEPVAEYEDRVRSVALKLAGMPTCSTGITQSCTGFMSVRVRSKSS